MSARSKVLVFEFDVDGTLTLPVSWWSHQWRSIEMDKEERNCGIVGGYGPANLRSWNRWKGMNGWTSTTMYSENGLSHKQGPSSNRTFCQTHNGMKIQNDHFCLEVHVWMWVACEARNLHRVPVRADQHLPGEGGKLQPEERDIVRRVRQGSARDRGEVPCRTRRQFSDLGLRLLSGADLWTPSRRLGQALLPPVVEEEKFETIHLQGQDRGGNDSRYSLIPGLGTRWCPEDTINRLSKIREPALTCVIVQSLIL